MHKASFSTKTVFMLSYFSTKTYTVGTYYKHLAKGFQMSTHNIGFRGEIRKIFTWYQKVLIFSCWYTKSIDIYMKTYIVGIQWKCLAEAFQMSIGIHNICFHGEIRKNIYLIPPLI